MKNTSRSVNTQVFIYADPDGPTSWYSTPAGFHYSDVIMGTMASQITSSTIVYSTVHSSADQRKHQSSASLALPVTGEFPAQMASNAENISIWWRHVLTSCCPSLVLHYLFSIKKLHFGMSSAKCWPFCSGRNAWKRYYNFWYGIWQVNRVLFTMKVHDGIIGIQFMRIYNLAAYEPLLFINKVGPAHTRASRWQKSTRLWVLLIATHHEGQLAPLHITMTS